MKYYDLCILKLNYIPIKHNESDYNFKIKYKKSR